MRLEPVDYDPFAQAPPPAGPQLEAVDYDPFKGKDVTQTPTQQLAPPSGVFPAVTSGEGAVVPPGTVLPSVRAPAPSPTPMPSTTDPGILEESIGDVKKGLHSTAIGAGLTAYMAGLPDALHGGVDTIANNLAQQPILEAQYPQSQATRSAAEELAKKKDQGWGGFLPSLGFYGTHPRLALSTTLQSLPTMIPSMVTTPAGALAGAVAGPGGAIAGGLLGAGLGSAASDFGDAFRDYANDAWKPVTKEDWKAILLDPVKSAEAGRYAAIHSGTVGAFDAFGGKLGGKFGMAAAGAIGRMGGKATGKAVGGVGAGLLTEATTGTMGEAGGQMAGYGTLELHDPTAVAGEFAGGFLAGAGGAAIEPTLRATNFGGTTQTPAAPADVRGAAEAVAAVGTGLMPQPAESQISGEYSTTETPVFYSPARRYVEQKGPGNATSEQWLATLNNAPGVKQEELGDLGVPQFFAERQGKVTKKEVLDYLDENAIRVEETQRVPVSPDEPGLGAFHVTDTNARFEAYTLPGDRQGYTELTLHLPTQNVEGENVQKDFVGGHYKEPNVVVHARVTDRVDRNGTPLALIEEIQSDWHQAGRKRGYAGQEMTDPAFMDSIDERIGNHLDRTRDRGPLFRAFQGGEGDTLTEAVRQGVITQDEATRYTRDMRGTNPVPAGPFRQSWDELAFKRMLRWAVDKGYRRVAWINAAEQMRRYPGGGQVGAEKRDQGMRQFYDRTIPSTAKRWAKRLGGTMGETVIPAGIMRNAIVTDTGVGTFVVTDQRGQRLPGTNTHTNALMAQIEADRLSGVGAEQTVQHIDIPQAGVDLIQRGLPMYSEVASRKKPGATLDELNSGTRALELGRQLGPALDAVAKQLQLTVNPQLVFHEDAIHLKGPTGRTTRHGALGMAMYGPVPTIHIALGLHATAAEVWATMTHELGHIVMENKYKTASADVRTAIKAAYDEFRRKVAHNENMRQLIAKRDNAVVAYLNTRSFGDTRTLNQMGVPHKRQYWTSFEEWFAEQVARWATSSAKPLTTVERFFKGLGNTIVDILEKAMKKFNLPFTAAPAMAKWLDSFHTDAVPFAEDIHTQTTVETTVENAPHMGPEETPVEIQPETLAPRDGMQRLFNGRPPREVQETLAYADKFNKIYKYGLGIHQVAQRNAHIVPLQEYTETIAVAQLTKHQIEGRARDVLKGWNKLGGRQGDAVAALIDDVQNMTYLTPDEVTQKVARFPTPAELTVLVNQHGVTREGLTVFKNVADTFNEHLTRYEAILRNEAQKITDVAKQQERQNAITAQIANYRSRPYFPAMRFGDYTITVKNDAGKVIHFETFEKERRRDAAADEIRTRYNVPKTQMELGKLDRQVRPLLGVPTQLLEMMAAKLELSKKQRDALQQLKFELSPAQSFKHRFQHKTRVAGYSQDFRRAYANYFVHGANHLMRAQYADRLRALARATRDEVKGTYDVTTRHEIVAYMNDHLENWLDPKSDWHAIRSIAFLWSLAYTPAAAAQNLTQTLMTSYPFLAQQFGDAKAIGAITRTGADFTTFYKRGTLKNATEFDLRAISRGIQRGTITEAMAPELAGFAEGRTLGVGFGGNELQRGLHQFNELGAKMFELAEQTNRRLVFRAALKLAQENPGARYVRDVVTKRNQEYELARTEGFTEAEAAAYVTAVDATLTTQFQYGREYAPRFMRGKLRSIFVFKTFIQNYVLFLANYPQAAVRSLLIMGFLGGLMGVPGADDLKEILKAIAYSFFGKDFDLEKEARRLVIQFLGEDENGRVAADMILHGVARQGYGIPAFMDMIGGTVGIDIPMPKFDRSASISAGTLLPVELGKLFGPPTQDQDAIIAAQAQKASGAVFGAGFNVYKALTNAKVDWRDSKRWERAVPRALGNIFLKAPRIYREGRERTSTGSTLVNYDVRDPMQLAEIAGIAAGYTPYRQSLQWNRVMAGQDAVKTWDVRRTVLMKQMGNAVLGKDPKEIERVKGAIQNFNEGLPPEAKGKTISGDALRQSIGTQARSRAAQEAELSVKKSDIPILREVQKLYPRSQATVVRRVPKTLQ